MNTYRFTLHTVSELDADDVPLAQLAQLLGGVESEGSDAQDDDLFVLGQEFVVIASTPEEAVAVVSEGELSDRCLATRSWHSWHEDRSEFTALPTLPDDPDTYYEVEQVDDEVAELARKITAGHQLLLSGGLGDLPRQ